MLHPAYRFELGPTVPVAEAEMSLHLALIAAEGLYGPAAVRLDARYRVDPPGAAVLVDGGGPVGRAVARVFTTLLEREYGEHAFAVRRFDAAVVADPADGPELPTPPLATAAAI